MYKTIRDKKAAGRDDLNKSDNGTGFKKQCLFNTIEFKE